MNEITKYENKSVSIKELENEIRDAAKKQIDDYLNERHSEVSDELEKRISDIGKRKETLNFFKAYKLLDDEREQFLDDEIKTVLKNDIQNIKDYSKFFSDIKSDDALMYLGLYYLPTYINKCGKKLDDNFLLWAKKITKANQFKLQSEELNEILEGAVTTLEFNSGFPFKEYKTPDKFESILDIATYNGCSRVVNIFEKIMKGFSTEYSRIEKIEKNKEKSQAQLAQILGDVGKVFDKMNLLLRGMANNNSFSFHLDVDPDQLQNILTYSKNIGANLGVSTPWKERFLNSLLDYYVRFAKCYYERFGIKTITDTGKLSKVMQMAFEYIKDQNTKNNILDSFNLDNDFLPFLPFEIIQTSFKASDNFTDKKKILGYLEERYKLNGSEKEIIKDLLFDLIRDCSQDIRIREYAFNTYFDWLKAGDDGHELDDYCLKVYSSILDDVENCSSPEYKKKKKKCLESLPKDISIYERLLRLQMDHKSVSEDVFKYIKSYFDESSKPTKLGDYLEYLLNNYEKMGNNREIDAFIIDVEKSEKCSKNLRSYILEAIRNEKYPGLLKCYMSNLENINRLENKQKHDLIKFVWDNRKNKNLFSSEGEIKNLLDQIIENDDAELIRDTLRIAWLES